MWLRVICSKVTWRVISSREGGSWEQGETRLSVLAGKKEGCAEGSGGVLFQGQRLSTGKGYTAVGGGVRCAAGRPSFPKCLLRALLCFPSAQVRGRKKHKAGEAQALVGSVRQKTSQLDLCGKRGGDSAGGTESGRDRKGLCSFTGLVGRTLRAEGNWGRERGTERTHG